MNFFKRLIWLCFYIPRVVVTKFRLGGSAIKRFFNRPVSQVKALGAGLAGGVAGGVKAIRKQDS
jgi:hypothetical protein